jgi:hypothetical protein
MPEELINAPIKENSYLKLVREILVSPVDSFDYYLNGTNFGKLHLLLLHFTLWIYAPITRLIQNLILLNISIDFGGIDKPEKWNEGLISSFLIFPIVLVCAYILDRVRNYYQTITSYLGEYRSDLVYLSFLPLSATSVFFFLPKPFNQFIFLIGLLYSMKIYYISLSNLSGYRKSDFGQMFIYFLVLILFISAIVLIAGGVWRNSI